MKYLLRFISLLFLIAGLNSSLNAQPQYRNLSDTASYGGNSLLFTATGNITGTIRNCSTNAVIHGVSVTCGYVGPVFTNSSGVYTITGVPSGSQTLSAVMTGYITYTAAVTIPANSTLTDNFCMALLPAYLQGKVTSATNPSYGIEGAAVTWNGMTTYSIAGGTYSFGAIYLNGPTTSTLQASKEGWNNFTQADVRVSPGTTTTVNISMSEDTPSPETPFIATLNSGQTAVNLSWRLPADDYDLIYDDGTQENFAVYANGGSVNKNAVRFTPLGYPTIVKGFYLDIGTAANYPAGRNPFTPVQMCIYNEVNGLPGSKLVSMTITPGTYGWTRALFTTPLTFNSGNFYLVMVQIGADTASPGIAIDTTTYQMRSYSQVGHGSWLSGPGNYMIRAIVHGSGGPLLSSYAPARMITASPIPGLLYEFPPRTITGVEGKPEQYPEGPAGPDNLLGYQVWRLLQGQESNPLDWTAIGTTTGLTMVDTSWPGFPCDPYRWAVEAQYINGWSAATFSNAVGKCWTCTVTVNVTLSCNSDQPIGAVVTFTNLLPTSDTVYTKTCPASGSCVFHNFWKGNYTLTVTKYGYTTYTQTPIRIMGSNYFEVKLLQLKGTPSGLVVHDSAAWANWFPAQLSIPFSSEPFTTGLDGWTPDGGSHWGWNASDGNPGGCMEFNGYPNFDLYYSQSITSPKISGTQSPVTHLQFDMSYQSTYVTNSEYLTVEVSPDGTTWHEVTRFVNNAASQGYITYNYDITQYAPGSGFYVRFRANGELDYYIYRWDVDNVKILSLSNPHDPCIIRYDFYLNGVVDYTPDTVYDIPPSHLVYGTTYTACVEAIYGSGNSPQICVTFTDHFLCPPDTVTATGSECNVLVQWHKPECHDPCTLKTYMYDDGTANDGYSAPPFYGGTICGIGNYFPIGTASGVIKSMDMYFSQYGSSAANTTTVYIYGNDQSTILGQSAPYTPYAATWPSGTWTTAIFYNVAYSGPFYALVNMYPYPAQQNFFDIDNTTIPPGYPQGLGWSDIEDTWTLVVNSSIWGGADPRATFLQRANVCEKNGAKDATITTIDPLQVSGSKNLSPVKPVPGASYSAILDGSNVAGNPPAMTPDENPTSTTVLGYNIFRDTRHIAYLPYPDTTEYYDYNLLPGTYQYTVNARYSTPRFNPPADTAVSILSSPPATVTIVCGYSLPFFEPWDNDSFSYQQWLFYPNQGHWSLSSQVGDPVPSADFTWEPVATNYTYALITPALNASMYTCADIYCDFDLKLVDLHNTGTEKLDVDVLTDGTWTNKAEYSDSGSFDWTLKHVPITSVSGRSFKIRFNANGANSGNIQHWYIDNIHIYAVCWPPALLNGQENQYVTSLTWDAPECPSFCSLKTYRYDDGQANDGYSCPPGFADSVCRIGNLFPDTGKSGVIKSMDMYFSQDGSSSAFSSVVYIYAADQSTILGQSSPFTPTAATWPSGTWCHATFSDVPYNSEFYALFDIFPYNSTKQNFFDIDNTSQPPGYQWGLGWSDIDGTWTLVVNSSIWYGTMATFLQRANVCENGDKNVPITTIDPLQVPGRKNTPLQTVQPGTRPKPGSNLGALVNNFVRGDPHPAPESPEGSILNGYNIYRADTTSNAFTLIHHNNSGDTTYQDSHPTGTQCPYHWRYFVTAVIQDSLNQGVTLCEPSSDTITVYLTAVGVNKLSNTITLYPNPANDAVNIVSSNEIKTIEVLDYVGQMIYKNDDVNLKVTQLNMAKFTTGVYFVKITTISGIKTTKLTVTH
jgi:hypothetical protein